MVLQAHKEKEGPKEPRERKEPQVDKEFKVHVDHREI